MLSAWRGRARQSDALYVSLLVSMMTTDTVLERLNRAEEGCFLPPEKRVETGLLLPVDLFCRVSGRRRGINQRCYRAAATCALALPTSGMLCFTITAIIVCFIKQIISFQWLKGIHCHLCDDVNFGLKSGFKR